MELVLFIVVVTISGVVFYWVLGNLYSLMRKPAVYFPLSLATKMAVVTIVGAPLAGVGGIVLAVLVFNHEFSKRRDYRKFNELIAGTIISLVSSAALLFSIYYLAWGILG